jgi:hypothetical protein
MYLPKKRLFVSMVYSFSEERTYKLAESNRNGVVGKPGTNIPNTPKDSDSVPKSIKNSLTILLLNCLMCCYYIANQAFEYSFYTILSLQQYLRKDNIEKHNF